ncbi:hypothetical protein [Achromobacter piechaudii]|uniref:hypothetical protein n=1 Tax=Achromobacter piechaudii TaxID=72556 RepID=UPI0012E6FCE1|nr:hypothetical protein [Achromobacter piechaudii]
MKGFYPATSGQDVDIPYHYRGRRCSQPWRLHDRQVRTHFPRFPEQTGEKIHYWFSLSQPEFNPFTPANSALATLGVADMVSEGSIFVKKAVLKIPR